MALASVAVIPQSVSASGTTSLRAETNLVVDPAFEVDINLAVWAVSVASDGSIFVAGDFDEVDGMRRNLAAKLKPNGTLDSGFVPAIVGDTGVDIAALPDGRVLVGGPLRSTSTPNQHGLVMLRQDGSVDTTFNAGLGPGASTTEMRFQSDGKILAIGNFGFARDQQFTIIRLNPEGSRDEGFTAYTNQWGWINGIGLQKDGKVVIAGEFTAVNGVPRNYIARLNPDGSLDQGFSPSLNGRAFGLTVQADGKILVGGRFTEVNGVAQSRIARLNSDGTLDATFRATAEFWGDESVVSKIAPQADGTLLVAGYFPHPQRVTSWLMRLQPDGTPDPRFTITPSNSVETIETLPSGETYLGGYFRSIGNLDISRIARLTTLTAPGAIVSARATPQRGAIRVTWSPPISGGAASSFEYSRDGTRWQKTSKTAIVVKGRSGSTLTVYVRAVNASGAGPTTKVTGRPR